jgi:hypothetical protein
LGSPAWCSRYGMPGDTAQMRVDELLARLGAAEAVEPAMRAIEHPGANLSPHLGGRAVHLPVEVVARVGLPYPLHGPRHSRGRCPSPRWAS